MAQPLLVETFVPDNWGSNSGLFFSLTPPHALVVFGI
jgi:hypothetical protein